MTSRGGAIIKKRIRKKSPEREEKVEEALATTVGGAIIKKRIRKRSPKKKEEIEEALATQQGGSIRYHSAMHKHLHESLSGKGGALDTPFVRKHMHSIMKNYDPTVLKTYLTGKVHRLPTFSNDHHKRTKRGTDVGADLLYMGGSMMSVSHCEDGYLVHHDARHHPFHEIV